MHPLNELLTALCCALVDQREAVRVHEHQEGDQLVLEVSVAEEDRGRVIGRQGRTAAALRVLMSAVAHERGLSCRIEVAR